jgi:hypothetical protein
MATNARVGILVPGSFAGAKTVMLGPAWPDVEQVTRIANEVVPRLL